MTTVVTRKNAALLAKRDGGYFCHYCHAPIMFFEDIPVHEVTLHVRTGYIKTMQRDPSIKALSIDHKVPRAKGGSNKLDNLLLSCEKCNQRKGKKDYDDFLEWLKDHPELQRRGK